MDNRSNFRKRRPRYCSSMESSQDEPCTRSSSSTFQMSLPTVLYTTSDTETDRGFSSESKSSIPSTLKIPVSSNLPGPSSSLPTSPLPYLKSDSSIQSLTSAVSFVSQTSNGSLMNVGSATGNPRNKCALQPGHSLMDWIRLGNSGKDLTGVGGRIRAVSLEELASHNTQNDAWLAIRGRVYNITHYLPYHPGGPEELMRGAGIDATQIFDKVHPWVNYDSLLAKCLIGPLRSTQIDPVELFGSSTQSSKSDRLREPSKAQELVRKSMENLANCITPVRKKMTKNDDNAKNSHPSRIMQCLIQSSDLPVSISRRAASSPVKKLEQTSDDRPPPLRFDWIQTSMKLTISVYTGALANPGVCASLVEGVLLIEVATDGWLRTIKLMPEAKLQGAIQLRVFAESGKLEVIAHKEHPELWKNCGDVTQATAVKVTSPRSVECTIIQVDKISHDTSLISLAPKQGLVAMPLGHHVRIHKGIGDTEVIRSYTPIGEGWSSNTNDTSSIKLVIKKYENGALSPYLANLKASDKITLSGPYGNFELQTVKTVRTMIFLAAGTGITPMLGLIKFMLLRTNPKCEQLHLLFFNKTEQDILFRKHLENIAKEDKRLSTTHILSQPSPTWTGLKGRIVAEILTSATGDSDIFKCVDVCSHLVFVCGPTEFTHTALDVMKNLGCKETCVHAFMG